jgi:hypothetical protein
MAQLDQIKDPDVLVPPVLAALDKVDPSDAWKLLDVLASSTALLNWWIHHGDSITPAQMDALYHQTLWSGITPPTPHATSTSTAGPKSPVPATRKLR